MKENSKKPHRKHVVTFPNLKRILDLLTAKAILTPRDNFFYCHPNQNVSDAKRLLRDKKFSGAPLKEKVLRRLVKLEKLEQCDGHIKHCSEVATEITGQDMIPEDTSIERLIGIFAGRKDNSPLFVAKNKSITGLITSADLDKIAVKVYFFILISALESLLLDIIGKGYEKYKSCLQNPGKVEKRRRRCKGELVGLDEYHYLMTPEILEIVWGSAIKKNMNVKTEDELNELKDFRNLVAHGNYIIIKDEDVRRLKNMNRRIRGYIKRLEQI